MTKGRFSVFAAALALPPAGSSVTPKSRMERYSLSCLSTSDDADFLFGRDAPDSFVSFAALSVDFFAGMSGTLQFANGVCRSLRKVLQSGLRTWGCFRGQARARRLQARFQGIHEID